MGLLPSARVSSATALLPNLFYAISVSFSPGFMSSAVFATPQPAFQDLYFCPPRTLLLYSALRIDLHKGFSTRGTQI
jgi:hypothetical protein